MAKLEKVAVFVFVAMLLLPLLTFTLRDYLPEGYILRLLSSMFMLASLALAQNVLLGYTGYPAFGGIAFFGVGGYASALISRELGLGVILSPLVGGVVAGTLALMTAPVLMRLKSHYFAIATLAFQLALGEMVVNLEFAGGSHGLNLPIYRGFLESYIFYLLFWLLMVLSFFVNLYIDRSVFGYALKAIREDELGAESVGVNTTLFKSLSFGIMALLTGVCGGLYSFWITYIDSTSMFDPILSVKTFVALLLGGVGTTVGPLVGAFLLEGVSELVWSEFLEFHGVVLGVLIVLGVLLLPRGVLGSAR